MKTHDQESQHGDLEGQSCRWWELILVALFAICLYLASFFRSR